MRCAGPRVPPSEKVTVITDEVSLEIAAAIVRELEDVGCRYQTWALEEVATRPLTDFPLPIAEDMESSQVSIFAVQAQANELKSRMQMTDVVNRRKIRHAHMVNINKRIMLEGMRADFLKVDRLSVKVMERLRKAKQVRAKTPAGTDLVVDLNPELPLGKDKWNYQHRKVGEPSRGRGLHHPRRGQRHIRDRWRGGRLLVRKIRRIKGAASHHSDQA